MSLKAKFTAELFGTAVFIMIGICVNAMFTLFDANGTYTSIALGWGLALMVGVYVAGAVSGAHLNPAVTIAMAVIGKMPVRDVVPYIVAQFIGAFIGAAIAFGVYYTKWLSMDIWLENTIGVFATFPAIKDSIVPGFVDQIVGTAVLLIGILAITNQNAGDLYAKRIAPLAIGLLLATIAFSFGGLHGFAINPARDLSPRFFAWLVGFSNTGFGDIGIWIVPVVAPVIGGVVGAVLYRYSIGCFLNKKN
jgi:glycerol uptake facilitator protein